MSIPGKVLIALLCAALASAAGATFSPELTLMQIFIPSAAASILSVVLSHRALPMPAAIQASAEQKASAPAAKKPSKKKTAPKDRDNKRSAPKEKSSNAAKKETPSGESESGTVKWFNGTKGFGFIVRESGEEIFVHHRSILGEGRRSLRDGEAVRFRVANTDKGPQAEEVEPVS